MHNILCTVGTLLVLGSGVLSAQKLRSPGDEILPLEEVQPGQTGFGLSVFDGHEPERFEVEVLGVWRQVQPDTSFILARLSGHGLDESGVVAGMSGSPVYLEGRLAGAVAFAWPFSLQPVAGITPIEAMQRLSQAAAGEAAGGALAATVSLSELAAVDLPQDLLERHLSVLARPALEGAGPGVVWTTFGLGTSSRALLAGSLGTVAPAGRAEVGAPSSLAPGSAVAGVLVDGDLQLAAVGTVTDRDGDTVLAFGHPFLGTGRVEIPMATAEVITVLSNQLSSFKITNLGETVGAFDLDRATGVRGRVGERAAMTPMRVTVHGDRSEEFRLRLARIPMVTPVLVAITVLGSMEAVTQAAGAQGLDLEARFAMAEHGELQIAQSFDGDTAGLDAAVYLLAFTGYLLNNRLGEVDLESIDVVLAQHQKPRTARLVEAHASKTLVRPGDTVSLNLDLIAYRGERQRTALTVTIPTSIPDGRYSLIVGDGVSIDVARLAIEQTAPVTFQQALRFLRSLHSRRELVVLGILGGQGLAVAGEVMPQLPGSVRSLWGAAASTSAVPLELAIAQEQEMQIAIPVEGGVRVDLEVRRQGPLAPEPNGEAGGDESGPGAEGKLAAETGSDSRRRRR